MSSLPKTLPKWYTYTVEIKNQKEKERGWTPKTTDIVFSKENKEIFEAWNGDFIPTPIEQYTVKIDNLKILTPIQVGGGAFPEGGVLPSQIAGIPQIPGSSIKGTLLSYLKSIWEKISTEEQQFWHKLICCEKDNWHWKPKTIRFQSISLKKDLKPYPLNSQQLWQVFNKGKNDNDNDNDNESSNVLAVQWQVSFEEPVDRRTKKFEVYVLLLKSIEDLEKEWLKSRIQEMFQDYGIGRGRRSGFGRLAQKPKDGKWEISLTGMKPCIQTYIPNSKADKKGQNGKYRWSPQVLKANLRGYFTRLCLTWLSDDDTDKLTNFIFGNKGYLSRLILTSFYATSTSSRAKLDDYTNIPASIAHETWIIKADCNSEFEELISGLLELASRLGGLGPGWRRPPHKLERFSGFRGSQFTLSYTQNANFNHENTDLIDLIHNLFEQIKRLAHDYKLKVTSEPKTGNGSIISIWKSDDPQAWRKIVHEICSTNNTKRPSWCGDSSERPSGYAVRQYDDRCLITVFDFKVEPTLTNEGFRKIYPL